MAPGRWQANAALALAGTIASLSLARGGPIECPSCPADFNGDFQVDGADLGLLLSGWDTAGAPYDLDASGSVGPDDLGVLLAAWGPCSTGDFPVDIDVDTDRDGAIEDTSEDDGGEESWTRTKGAFFLVNVDDDDGDKKSDSIEWGKTTLAGFEPQTPDVIDEKINGDATNTDDEKDITPFRIRRMGDLTGKVVLLGVTDLEQIRAIHVFGLIKVGTTKFWGGPAQGGATAIKIDDVVTKEDGTKFRDAIQAADVTMGLEGLKFRLANDAVASPFAGTDPRLFSGYVDLEVRVVDATDNSKVCGRDVVRLKVAPFIVLPNSRNSEEIYVQKIDHPVPIGDPPGLYNNASLRKAFKDNLPADHLKEYTTDDQWAQDDTEIGYTATPISTHRLAAYTQHHGAATSMWLRDLVIKKDRGIFRGADPAVETDYDYGGDIELLPPTGLHPLGIVCLGKDMSPEKRQFFISQEVQMMEVTITGKKVLRPIELDTRWLAVGHVDEIASFLKEADGGDLTVILASPDKARALIDGAPTPAAPADGSPPGEDDPGTLFARGADDIPLTQWGTADMFGGPSSLIDIDRDFTGLAGQYRYVRIYEGPGEGQIAHVLDMFANEIVVDMVWKPFEPTSFVIDIPMQDGPPGFRSHGLTQFYYPLQEGEPAAGWFVTPGPGSRYILIEDSWFWPQSPFSTLAGLPALGEKPAAITLKEVKKKLAAGEDVRKINDLAQAKINAAKAAIVAAAKKANGGAQTVDFKEVPVIYMSHLAGTGLADETAFAWTPGAANIQYGQKPGDAKPRKFFIAAQLAISDGQKLFETDISTTLGGFGDVFFPDDWKWYHAATGEVHCGSNVMRQPFAFKWWEQQPATVPEHP